jgi:hypothetical protein
MPSMFIITVAPFLWSLELRLLLVLPPTLSDQPSAKSELQNNAKAISFQLTPKDPRGGES